MLDPGRLAVPVRVAVLDADEVVVAHGGGVGEGQGEGLHGSVEGTPDVYDAVARLQERVCFVGQVVAYPGFGGRGRLVDVDPGDGGAAGGGGGAADGVVEKKDPLGAGDVVEDELLDFGVVHFLDVRVVGEVVFVRGDVLERLEGVLVEIELVFLVPDVVDFDRDLDVVEVALRVAFGLFLDVVVGC